MELSEIVTRSVVTARAEETLAAVAAARKSARRVSRSMRAAGPLQALSRLRPRARRAAMTLRPPLVAMRARKP